ncbi:MAG: energy-coupled thiamine transporter ThiT [Lachnospiraceae bacterium]|nr:energy-coupled thiamine transporter ThiT [Lachnospiraceae bacterium]
MSNFVTEVVNDWGETTYVPTLLGNIILAVIVIALLVLAVLASIRLSKKSTTAKLTTKQLSFCAMAVALGTVLSYIKLYHFPTGGSITLLSMLVICLPGYFYGLSAGILTGIAYGVLQMMIDPYILFPAQMVIDYILAFGAMGLSGLFSGKKFGLVKGYITAVLGRYVFAVLSGYLFFGAYAWEGWNPLTYSLAYNAIYIFSECAITLIVLCIPPVNKALASIKTMANN